MTSIPVMSSYFSFLVSYNYVYLKFCYQVEEKGIHGLAERFQVKNATIL